MAWSAGKPARALKSGNGGKIDGLIPDRHIKGDGSWKYDKEKGRQGVGNTVTLPMKPEKEARIRRLVK